MKEAPALDIPTALRRPEIGGDVSEHVSFSFKTHRRGACRMGLVRVGIGLPAAVPETDMTLIGRPLRATGDLASEGRTNE